MLRDFLYDRDFRWQVAAVAPPALLLPSRSASPLGFPMDTSSLLSGMMDHEMFTCIVTEELISWLSSAEDDGEVYPEAVRLTDQLVRAILSRYVDHEPGSGAVQVRAVPRNPQIGNPFFRSIMVEWGEYYDCDDTAVVLSVLAKYASLRHAPTRDVALSDQCSRVVHQSGFVTWVVSLLGDPREHLMPEGKKLVSAGHNAFLTYKGEGVNDVDPTVNIDVLESLAHCRHAMGTLDNAGVMRGIHCTLRYLTHLTQRGVLFSPFVNSFYTGPVVTYMWRRFVRTFESMQDDERRRFDPEGRIAGIDDIIQQFWKAHAWGTDLGGLRFHDQVLLAAAYPTQSPWSLTWWKGAGTPESWIAGEFFSLSAPLHIMYGCPLLIPALLLNLPRPE